LCSGLDIRVTEISETLPKSESLSESSSELGLSPTAGRFTSFLSVVSFKVSDLERLLLDEPEELLLESSLLLDEPEELPLLLELSPLLLEFSSLLFPLI